MKILHVITRRQLRGAEIFASQLSAEFIKQGHEVYIVALQSPKVFPVIPGVKYIDLNVDSRKRLLPLKAWKKFAALIREIRPDIVQANASETLKFTVLSRFFFRWHALLVYRNANKVSDFIRSTLSKSINTWLATRVDHVISVSENCRIDFVSTFGLPETKTTTIPIGTMLGEKLHAKPEMPLVEHGYWINVASLVPEKNHIGLLRIFKAYTDQGGKNDLVIVGDGKEKENLIQLTTSLSLTQRVHFLGYRQDILALMQHAAGLVLPSLIEGLPGVILEAMASRLPVIAYDVGGIPEVIENGITGSLVAKSDEQKFVSEMLRLEQDGVRRAGIVERAYERCVSTYGIEAVASQFLEKYKALLRAS
jgi:L-malate glycosyltransferase